jgi:hypothetical protein
MAEDGDEHVTRIVRRQFLVLGGHDVVFGDGLMRHDLREAIRHRQQMLRGRQVAFMEVRLIAETCDREAVGVQRLNVGKRVVMLRPWSEDLVLIDEERQLCQ